jgi:isopentenyl phosphate kinase
LNDLKILKIGGSVITDKSPGVFERPRKREIKRIAREISSNPQNLILVHGAGSFGHPYVEKYNLKSKKDPRGITVTHLACKRLNTMICDALVEEGVNAIPIHPFSALRYHQTLEVNGEFLRILLKNEIVPVLHGDMVYNKLKNSFEVLSGDRIVFELAILFDIGRIGFATDMPGIILNGEVKDELLVTPELIRLIDEANTKSDVTGGMRGKLESLLKVPESSEVLIFNGLESGNIQKFLDGKKVGTKLKRG